MNRLLCRLRSIFVGTLLALTTSSEATTIGYWNAPSGSTTLTDQTGNGNHLSSGSGLASSPVTITPDPLVNPDPGVTSASGSIDLSSLTLAPTIISADPFKLTDSTSFTFEGWLQTSATSGVIAGDKQYVSAGAYEDGWLLYIVGNNLSFNYQDFSYSTTITCTSTINDGSPHHFAAVWDHTAGQMRLYIDGELEASANASVDSFGYDSLGFAIGARDSDGDGSLDDSPFVGLLDEMRFSDVAMIPDDTLFGRPPDLSPPVIESVSPENEAFGVSLTPTLLATFDEDIALTGSGTITIRDIPLGGGITLPDLDVIIPLPDDRVTTDGNTLSIALQSELKRGTFYEVIIDEDAIEDQAETPNAFAGTSAEQWTFTTLDNASVAWVTNQGTIDTDWKAMLEGAGYSVTLVNSDRRPDTPAEIDTFNSFDIVIGSPTFGPLGTDWSNINVPVIMMNAYYIDSIGWFVNDGGLTGTFRTSMKVEDANDPIWEDMGVSNGDSVQVWTSGCRTNNNPTINPDGTKVLTDGTLVGIVRWSAGTVGNAGRLYFGHSYNDDILRLTDAGKTMFLNAVNDFTTSDASYTVTYVGNGSDGGSVPIDANTYEDRAAVTVLGNTGNLSRTGSSFVGWNSASDGSGVEVVENDIFTIRGNVTLYAQWTDSTTYADYAGENGGSPTDPGADNNGNGVQDGVEYAFYEALGTGVKLESPGQLGQVLWGTLDAMGTPNDPSDDHLKYAVLLPASPPADVIYRVYASSVAPLDSGKTLLATCTGGDGGSWTLETGVTMETGPNAEDVIIDTQTPSTSPRRFAWLELEITGLE